MQKLISIIGTNASGKSNLGFNLAKEFNGEIVSADSRQLYKGLDLGTGKISKAEMGQIKHYMIDILDLNQPYSLLEYQKNAYLSIDEIISKNKVPFLVGGTGLYTRSIVEGYVMSITPPNEELRKELEGKSKEELIEILKEQGVTDLEESISMRKLCRKIEKLSYGVNGDYECKPRYEVLQMGVTWSREKLHERIKIRLDKRLDEGMIDEVENLIKQGATGEFLLSLGLEYRYIYKYLQGEMTYNEFYEKLFTEIKRFAKRQMTWFRKEKNTTWLDMEGDYYNQAKNLVEQFLNR